MSDFELERIRQRELARLTEELERRQRGEGPGATPTDQVIAADDATLQRVVARGITVVDCYADWCGPCKMMAPWFDEAARRFAGKAQFAKLDIDRNPQTAMRYHVQSIPTLLVFQDGQLVDRVAGALRPPQLALLVQRHL